MRCKFISDTRCKNKATDKYHGIAVCLEHKTYLEERVKNVLGESQPDFGSCSSCGGEVEFGKMEEHTCPDEKGKE